MKYSTKLSDTVHVMVLIAINQENSLSSASIAESVHTNPGFVRQLMLKLKKAGLMTSVAGHARPSLSKPADQITLLDVYKAVEGEKPLLHLDTHTNPDCGVGINIQLSLQGFYNEIQKNTGYHKYLLSANIHAKRFAKHYMTGKIGGKHFVIDFRRLLLSNRCPPCG